MKKFPKPPIRRVDESKSPMKIALAPHVDKEWKKREPQANAGKQDR